MKISLVENFLEKEISEFLFLSPFLGLILSWFFSLVFFLGFFFRFFLIFFLLFLWLFPYCLVREAFLDEGDKKIAPKGRNWVIGDEAKMGVFIMSLSNMLRMRTIALAKYYLLGIKEAVEKGRKKITAKEVPVLEEI